MHPRVTNSQGQNSPPADGTYTDDYSTNSRCDCRDLQCLLPRCLWQRWPVHHRTQHLDTAGERVLQHNQFQHGQRDDPLGHVEALSE